MRHDEHLERRDAGSRVSAIPEYRYFQFPADFKEAPSSVLRKPFAIATLAIALTIELSGKTGFLL